MLDLRGEKARIEAEAEGKCRFFSAESRVAVRRVNASFLSPQLSEPDWLTWTKKWFIPVSLFLCSFYLCNKRSNCINVTLELLQTYTHSQYTTDRSTLCYSTCVGDSRGTRPWVLLTTQHMESSSTEANATFVWNSITPPRKKKKIYILDPQSLGNKTQVEKYLSFPFVPSVALSELLHRSLHTHPWSDQRWPPVAFWTM